MKFTAFLRAVIVASGIARSTHVSDARLWALGDAKDVLVADEPVLDARASTFLTGMSNALEVMQNNWYQLWIGAWPTAIDWTGAVLSTYVFAALESLLGSSNLIRSNPTEILRLEDRISGYYGQMTAYYFGENTFALRNEANDDALWVVLDWLEGINFASAYSSTFRLRSGGMPWHGTQWNAAFSHRARIFYEIASKGWNTTLCDGGMMWDNRIAPYKNAITNELWISASVGMYLMFPGDNNTSPYLKDVSNYEPGRFNKKYLNAAKAGYHWLSHSKMLNKQGLYVDGYHIRGWQSISNPGTGKCDDRNEMVYTYNQGVILSGLRSLWESTGDDRYLYDAHKLVKNVMKATGWKTNHHDSTSDLNWAGLGRAGILEEYCDSAGTCNQDSQTFKGIFMDHLTRLCHPLPREPRFPGKTHSASRLLATLHLNACKQYAPWVQHNADAAGRTRNDEGVFGSWWGAYLQQPDTHIMMVPPLPLGAVDYFSLNSPSTGHRISAMEAAEMQWSVPSTGERVRERSITLDPNDRGRGRTVETQGGGLAVMRAAWELSQLTK